MALPIPKTVIECWRGSADYAGLRRRLRDHDNPVAFVNGCFDLFHSGHVKLLHFAATELHRLTRLPIGGRLVVGINSDASVRRLKGTGKPTLPWAERAAVVAAVDVVDAVVGFDEDTPFDLVADLQPRLLVKGSEYETKPVPEAAALGCDGTIVYFKRPACGPSSTWVAGRVILGEAERKQEAAMVQRRGVKYGD